jgi:hypothetical protein
MTDATARRAGAKALRPAPRAHLRLVSNRSSRPRSAGRPRARRHELSAGEIVVVVATLALVTIFFASLHHAVTAPWPGVPPFGAPAW